MAELATIADAPRAKLVLTDQARVPWCQGLRHRPVARSGAQVVTAAEGPQVICALVLFVGSGSGDPAGHLAAGPVET
jgi:hypothetical protein